MAHLEREDSNVHEEAVRLNKFLATAGIGSRRKNDELILSGAVKVNGKTVRELGTKIRPGKDHVVVNGKTVALAQKNVYILFNKPKDCITTLSDERGRTTVVDYVKTRERIFPVGRLDRNTTGVLILTNDGELANSLVHPKGEIDRLYRATLDRPILSRDVDALKRGVRLEEGVARVKNAEVIQGSKRQKILIALQEGRNREVRRMFEAIGYDVKQLDRVSFGGITPLGVPRGRWRHLSTAEVRGLKQLADHGSRE